MIVDLEHPDFWRTIGGAYATDPTVWHGIDWPTWPSYKRLVAEMASHLFPDGMPYYFQAEPNLRIMAPGDSGIPFHCDSEFGHLDAEWNVWIPLTEITDDCQRLWAEGGPVQVKLSQAYLFAGSTARHGSIWNTSDKTRRSMDFRLIPKEAFYDNGKTTVEYGVPMNLGNYWRAA